MCGVHEFVSVCVHEFVCVYVNEFVCMCISERPKQNFPATRVIYFSLLCGPALQWFQFHKHDTEPPVVKQNVQQEQFYKETANLKVSVTSLMR